MYVSSKLEACPACKSNQIRGLETLPTLEIADLVAKCSQKSNALLTEAVRSGKAPATVYIDKCDLCGLEFANPTFAAGEDWYSDEMYGVRWEYHQCLKDLKPGSKVLEIGCGEGVFLNMAAHQGHQVFGLDFNAEAIQTARQKGLEVVCWNLKELHDHLPDAKFDTVAFFHVIEHVEDLDSFFHDLSQIVRQGSTLHFSCPGPNRWTTHLEPEKKVGLSDVWDCPPHHQTRWNQKAVTKFLTRSGWKLHKYLEEPFDWYGTSVYLTLKDLDTEGQNLGDVSAFGRKLKIAQKMLATAVPAMKYKGMSMYCQAIHQ